MKKDVPYLQIAIGIAVIAAAIIAARLLPAAAWLADFQTFIRDAGPIGYIAYVLMYAIAGLFFSGLILTIGAGALFGALGGTIVVLIGATMTATIAFLLARTVLRSRIEKLVASRPSFAAIDQAVAREGAKIVFLVRLAAVFPFLFVNYAFGLTGIKTGAYVLATVLGIIPGTVAFVYLGAAGAALATQNATKTAFMIAGVVIAFAVSIFVARIASAAVKRAAAESSHGDVSARTS